MLLAKHDLSQRSDDHKQGSCAQQDAPQLVPELSREAVQGQRLVGEQEAGSHKEVGEEDDDECDDYERGVAGGGQAVGPGVQLEAGDLPLQDVVCNGPGQTDSWVLRQPI